MEAQYLTHQEAVQREAQRIASLSAWKLLRSRTQRGGMRLHRSLQLSMVMRSARDLLMAPVYVPQPLPPPAAAPGARESRKRRSCESQMLELVPTKRACLWQETPLPQPQGGAFPGLAEVLQRLLGSSGPPLPGGCRALGAGAMPGVISRAVEAF
ncbi:immediate early response gene 2 [Pelobates cultripes]|uniref:Immediate early response gene 2 n=1 Tax=Pelobates cultripes TaxID=61616 RepID=A0AAD1VXU2_PELCU|nr:immediate early response gene 2 [Pelobates cultripes]